MSAEAIPYILTRRYNENTTKEKEDAAMTEQAVGYQIWVNWDHCVVSFHPENGFDLVYFHSEDNYHANIRILVQSGFRFQ